MSTGVCVCVWNRLIAGLSNRVQQKGCKRQGSARRTTTAIGNRSMCLDSVKEVSGMLMITLGIFYEAKIALWRLYSDT